MQTLRHEYRCERIHDCWRAIRLIYWPGSVVSQIWKILTTVVYNRQDDPMLIQESLKFNEALIYFAKTANPNNRSRGREKNNFNSLMHIQSESRTILFKKFDRLIDALLNVH